MWGIVNKKFSSHMDTADRVVGLVERSWKYVEVSSCNGNHSVAWRTELYVRGD